MSLRILKPVLFFLCLAPLARLILLGLWGDLGPNPIEFITRSTGTWTLNFLCLTLCMSPLRWFTGWRFPIQLRRMIGLFCFFYASLHFSIWFWLDQNFDLAAMWADVLKRPFITAGFSAFILLIPLAATSNSLALRYLRQRWSQLHRLVYLIALIAILHYFWHKAGKNDFDTVSIYAIIIFTLLAIRLPWLRARLPSRT